MERFHDRDGFGLPLDIADIEVGMFVTVCKPQVKFVNNSSSLIGGGVQQLPNRNGMGDTLEVTAVCAPFVVVRNHSSYNGERVDQFDTREMQFMLLNREYVVACGIEIEEDKPAADTTTEEEKTPEEVDFAESLEAADALVDAVAGKSRHEDDAD